MDKTDTADVPLAEFSQNPGTIRTRRVAAVAGILLFGGMGLLSLVAWFYNPKSDYLGLFLSFMVLPFTWFFYISGRFFRHADLRIYADRFASRYYFNRTYAYNDLAGLALYLTTIGQRGRGYVVMARLRCGKTKRTVIPGFFEDPRGVVAAISHHSGFQCVVCETHDEFREWEQQADKAASPSLAQHGSAS